ncbi:MAG: hypothetical protein Q4F67_04185 [Propionibacteriaceae bacterium]|nr:hypothetical protein [Propionibacteriaceae bacterium]
MAHVSRPRTPRKYRGRVHLSAAIALTANLNAARHTTLSPEVAARAVVGDHAAHHVVDHHGLLGLDPLSASELDAAIAAALLLVDSDWLLAIPRPGRLAPLAGPPDLTSHALEAGAAVVPARSGPAWIPHAVGPAIQWLILPARAPQLTPDPAEADRLLRQLVVRAGRSLADLPLGTTERPEIDPPPALPPAYGQRSQQALARAWQLSHALKAALADDGDTLHLHAIEARRRTLSELRDAADQALCAAVSWTGAD